ncbi:MAG: hypothetical protein KatS3mg076_1569 [Candidatus Binatia bacterium]|nr:MAG: hypothetical protein KatS3mg076_1569 [Candidatus Binatia bacterium]
MRCWTREDGKERRHDRERREENGRDPEDRKSAEFADGRDRGQEKAREPHDGGQRRDENGKPDFLEHGRGRLAPGARAFGRTVVLRHHVDRVGDADRHEQRRQDQCPHRDPGSEGRHEPRRPDDSDQNRSERDEHPPKRPEFEQQHDHREQHGEGKESRRVFHHVAGRVHLDRRDSREREALGTFVVAEHGPNPAVETARDELVVAHPLEAQRDRRGAGVRGHHVPDVDRRGEHPLAKGSRLGIGAGQRAKEPARSQPLVGELHALHGREPHGLADPLQARELAGHGVDFLERGRTEDVLRENADDPDLLAPELLADLFVEKAFGIARRKELFDRAVDLERRGKKTETRREECR